MFRDPAAGVAGWRVATRGSGEVTRTGQGGLNSHDPVGVSRGDLRRAGDSTRCRHDERRADQTRSDT